MKEKNNIIKKLSNNLFWDVDVSKMEDDSSSRLIIERVFSLGDVEEMRAVIAYYGQQQVVQKLGSMNYLDPKTLQFVSVLFDKPKEEFKCFTQKSSVSRLWNS